MSVAIEMEILHELEKVRESIVLERNDVNKPTLRLSTLRGRESGLTHVLEFMAKNMKKGAN